MRLNQRFLSAVARFSSWLFLLTIGIGAASERAVAQTDRKSPADFPVQEKLQDPFQFQAGGRVKTPEDWKKRRKEILSLFEEYQYGHLPPKPDQFKIIRGKKINDETNGAIHEDVTLEMEHQGNSLSLVVRVSLPAKADGAVPAVVQGSFGRRRPARTPRPGAKATPARPSRSKMFFDRGYAIVEFNFQDVAIDNKDRARTAGIYKLFGKDIDCGGLLAWGWGISRAIDLIEQVKEIDAKKIVVTGHSRYGKAALVAGAFDERIAITVPSHSGCTGTAPYRFIYGKSEQLQNIVGFAPQWFRPEFKEYVGNVNRLPVDQHLLRAAVAPRALLATEGTKDSWTNPEGSQLTHQAAKKVYEFLGAGNRISIRYRPVGHVPSNEDLLEFADHIFLGKPLSAEFGNLAYPEETKGFDWTTPQTSR